VNEIPWKRVLITGVCGFAGSHLAARLAGDGCEVHGVDLAGVNRRNLDDLAPSTAVHEADLTDRGAVERTVAETRPEAVFHLAGRIAGDDLEALLAANVVGTEMLIRALAGPGGEGLRVIVVTGSAAEYGPVAESDLPIDETAPCRPVNLYGVSKVTQSTTADTLAKRFDLPLVRTRTFNITGPGEPVSLAASNFAKQIVEIEAGKREAKILVGPLEGMRDFSDIRDVVRAYAAAARAADAIGGIFNVCSGRAVRIGEILDRLITLSSASVEIAPNPAFAGRSDTSVFIGNGARAKETFGYEPEIALDRSLGDLLAWWRRMVVSL